MTSSGDRIHFSYWTDPLCIWAFVAEPKLHGLLTELGNRLDVEHRIVPVFGSVPWRFQQGSWAKAGVAGRVKTTRDVASRFGFDQVSGEVWAHDPPASSWAPSAAIKAAFSMEAVSQAPDGSAARFQSALRRALFVENRNIARRSVQLAVAEGCRLDRAEIERRLDDGTALAKLWEDFQAKEDLHIQGSPTFVFDGGRAMLYGNVAAGVLRATVDELVRGLAPGRSAC